MSDTVEGSLTCGVSVQQQCNNVDSCHDVHQRLWWVRYSMRRMLEPHAWICKVCQASLLQCCRQLAMERSQLGQQLAWCRDMAVHFNSHPSLEIAVLSG